MTLLCITVALWRIFKGAEIYSCSILLDNIKPYKNKSNSFILVFWNYFYLLRWIVTILILLTLRDLPQLQISSLLGLSLLFQFMIAGIFPFEDRLTNCMWFFNEAMVSCYLYVLFTLTDFHAKEKNLTREKSGIGLISILLFTVFVNVSKFLVI